MQYAVDDKLLEAAQAVLGTASAEETIEVSLRRAIGAGPSRRPAPLRHIRTDEEWEALRQRLRTPPSEEELTRRRASLAAMDRLRVKVGRDFNVAEVLREIRDRGLNGFPDQEHGEYDER